MAAVIFSALLLLSASLNLWQWWVGRKFPLHRRRASDGFAPPITLLKPMKGADEWTVRCLESWLCQNYSGPVQVIVGLGSNDDAARPLVESLQAKFPALEFMICPPGAAPNAKAGKLESMVRQARHELIVVSDADILAPPDLLQELMFDLKEESVGLVHCFYALGQPSTPAMRWEAANVNADFWTQVLQSASIQPVDFALGAVMAFRAKDLEAAGGFGRLKGYLADDYQLGQGIAALGKKNVFSPVVVESVEAPRGWREIWRHQLRWARTLRACQPVGYFFSILANLTVWNLLWFLVVGARVPAAISILLVLILFREATARENARRLLQKERISLPLFLVVDLLNFLRWLVSFFGNTVEWRGERLRILSGGRLEKRAATTAGHR